jgi:hypothetical protein
MIHALVLLQLHANQINYTCTHIIKNLESASSAYVIIIKYILTQAYIFRSGWSRIVQLKVPFKIILWNYEHKNGILYLEKCQILIKILGYIIKTKFN